MRPTHAFALMLALAATSAAAQKPALPAAPPAPAPATLPPPPLDSAAAAADVALIAAIPAEAWKFTRNAGPARVFAAPAGVEGTYRQAWGLFDMSRPVRGREGVEYERAYYHMLVDCGAQRVMNTRRVLMFGGRPVLRHVNRQPVWEDAAAQPNGPLGDMVRAACPA